MSSISTLRNSQCKLHQVKDCGPASAIEITYLFRTGLVTEIKPEIFNFARTTLGLFDFHGRD